MQISARNKLPGKVTDIKAGEAIANVELDVAGMRLVASVTVEAVRELGIEPGKDVTALIKASDVMLGVE
ncbi:MAG TPA: TOBE domain-containing protein [Solirubrobacterales bacterium]|jgi:molybdopterin-binding protein